MEKELDEINQIIMETDWKLIILNSKIFFLIKKFVHEEKTPQISLPSKP